MRYDFPKVFKHKQIEEVFDNVYFVKGSLKVSGMAFSRNMTIIREGDDLTLINSIRLNEAELVRLDSLGKVKNILRIAGFHGMDDPFYKHRYNAKIYSVKANYIKGLKISPELLDSEKQTDLSYFTADEELNSETLPLQGASIHNFNSAKIAEALILFKHKEGNLLITGDSLQNWAKPDEFFNFFARVIFRFIGFFIPHNVGPAWLRSTETQIDEIKDILKLDFNHVLPAHGGKVMGNAKELFKINIDKL